MAQTATNFIRLAYQVSFAFGNHKNVVDCDELFHTRTVVERRNRLNLAEMAFAPLVGWFDLKIFHDQVGKGRRTFVVVGKVLPPERPLADVKMAAIDISRDKIWELVGGEIAGLSYGDVKSSSPAWNAKKPITAPAVDWLEVWEVREE
jgi:hypothetical protein